MAMGDNWTLLHFRLAILLVHCDSKQAPVHVFISRSTKYLECRMYTKRISWVVCSSKWCNFSSFSDLASCMWPSTRKGIKVLKTWSKLEGGQTQITHRFLSKEGKGSLNLSLKSPLMQEQLIGSKGHHTPLWIPL